MSCGICKSLYPEIVPETDDICGDCQAAWEDVDLHEVAVELEQELEQPLAPIAARRW
ncbi:MAG: hypothetical protein GXY44_03725 [Phycisphaerales bacterium]|nr:hypothetical protein [Phycisphaerales bacterium]